MLPSEVLNFWITEKKKEKEKDSEDCSHNDNVLKRRAADFHKRYVAKRDALAS
jgi:hypothetical protein